MSDYRIKPLAWTQRVPGQYVAHTILGHIIVYRYPDGWWYKHFFSGQEGKVLCESLESALQKANEFYLDALIPALEPVSPNVIWTCGECGKENRWEWDADSLADEHMDRMECDHCGRTTNKFTITQFGEQYASDRQ